MRWFLIFVLTSLSHGIIIWWQPIHAHGINIWELFRVSQIDEERAGHCSSANIHGKGSFKSRSQGADRLLPRVGPCSSLECSFDCMGTQSQSMFHRRTKQRTRASRDLLSLRLFRLVNMRFACKLVFNWLWNLKEFRGNGSWILSLPACRVFFM